jgi:hypothetical protein
MDSSKPTCYLAFPEDAQSVAAADELRSRLEQRGITVLPPVGDEASSSSFSRPFYWLRQADAVVLDMTDDTTWVVYDAGAAQALNKLVIPVAQPSDGVPSPIRWQLPRVLDYERGQVAALADYVVATLERSLSAKS